MAFSSQTSTLEVCAAVVFESGRFLISRRLPGVHCSLLWEFPGGKLGRGESHSDCLVRELLEELGITIAVGEHLMSVFHEYSDLSVLLHFYRCSITSGEPVRLQCFDFRWVPYIDLPTLDFPAADRSFLNCVSSFFRDYIKTD